MHSILVPTDFSDNAALALKFAGHIASGSGFKIRLIHVYELPLLERYLNEEVVKPIPDNVQDELFEKFIFKAIPSEEERSKLDISWRMQEGNVSTEIQNYCEEIDPAMIIMGCQGSGSDQLDKLLLGGTAQKVIRRMHMPIMLVPPDAQYKPIRKIAYASDFSAEDREIIAELIGFSDYFDADVVAVHVKEDKWDVDEKSIQTLKTAFSKELASGKLRFELVENNNIMEGLDQFVDDENVSLLTLLKKYHNLWDRLVDRSTSLKIALHAHIPTIIFKEL